MISIDKVETVRKFKVDNHPGFFIEEFIEEFNDGLIVEFWLYHEDYGVKMLMFGAPPEDYIVSILSNQVEDYIDIYMHDYIKEEI